MLGWVTFLTVPRNPTSERKQVANSPKTGSLSLRLDWHWTRWKAANLPPPPREAPEGRVVARVCLPHRSSGGNRAAVAVEFFPWVPKAPRVVSSSCQNAWIGASLEETPQG